MTERTTVRLDPQLLQKAKLYAVQHKTTLTKVIEEALTEKLTEKRVPSAKPFKLVTFSGALQPGVNLDSNSALLDLMDGLE